MTTQDQVDALSLGNIISWLMQTARTTDELVQVSSVCKLQCEAHTSKGETQLAFSDVTSQADAAQRARFPAG